MTPGKRMLFLYRFCFILIVLAFINGCSNDGPEKFVPDVSDISVEVELRRFEKDLFSLDTNQIGLELTNLRKKYPAFAAILMDQILKVNNNPIGEEAFVKGFLQHPSILELKETVFQRYNDFTPFQKEFEQAFKYLKYYFPNKPTPDLTTFISEYGVGAFIYKEQSLAIGLDFFLGLDYPYQNFNPSNPNFSKYLTRTFTPEHLVSKSIQPLVEDMVGETSGDRLIDHMINNGKKLYFLDHLLPYTPDSVKMEVTADQVDWLNGNEYEMWTFFLEEDLLYSTDWYDIRKFVEFSPSSPGMPKEAPGRTGNWVGWQIVKSFMKENADVSLEQLLQIDDAQQIMDRSRYKPRSK